MTRAVIHIAGPLDGDDIQRCSRCGTVLKDFRRVDADERLGHAHLGGVVYAVGSRVEVGPAYQSIPLHNEPLPLCEPVEAERRIRIEVGDMAESTR